MKQETLYHVIEEDKRYIRPIVHSKGTWDECWQYRENHQKYSGQYKIVSHEQLRKMTGQNCPC